MGKAGRSRKIPRALGVEGGGDVGDAGGGGGGSGSSGSNDEGLSEIEKGIKNLDILQNEYPNLDRPLIAAIHGDTPLDLAASRAILTALSRETILGEEDEQGGNYLDQDQDQADELLSRTTSHSTWTTITGEGTSEDANWDDEVSSPPGVDTKDGKVAMLKLLFPQMSRFSILKVLEKCQGSVEEAAGELVRRSEGDVGANATGQGAEPSGHYYDKGAAVDEFYLPVPPGKGKRKGKKHHHRHGSSRAFAKTIPTSPTMPASSSSGPSLTSRVLQETYPPSQDKNGKHSGSGNIVGVSKWAVIESDTSFLSSALHIPHHVITSAYHKHSGDLGKTIRSLLEEYNVASPGGGSPTEGAEGDSGGTGDQWDGTDGEYIDQLMDLIDMFPDLGEDLLWKLLKMTRRGGGDGGLLGEKGQGQGGANGSGSRRRSRVDYLLENGMESGAEEIAMENLFRIAEILSLPSSSSNTTYFSTTSSLILTSALPTSPTISSRPQFKNPFSVLSSETVTINPRNPLPTPNLTAHLSQQHLYQSRSLTFSRAADSYRKAKSNRLMGGATAYYNQQGHALSSAINNGSSGGGSSGGGGGAAVATSMLRSKRVIEDGAWTKIIEKGHFKTRSRNATAANANTPGSSSSSVPGSAIDLDLHGLTLQEAILVTRTTVRNWWEQEEEIRKGSTGLAGKRVRPLVLVTGQGRHSRDGRGVLGQGVGRMLRREGWKVEGGGGREGVVVVVGRVRG